MSQLVSAFLKIHKTTSILFNFIFEDIIFNYYFRTGINLILCL